MKRTEPTTNQVDIPLEITARLEYVARQKLNFHEHKGNGIYDLQKQRELKQQGARMLKWALVGCWKKGEKSLDEMVRALMKLGVAGTVDEATALTEQLLNDKIFLDLGGSYRGTDGSEPPWPIRYGRNLNVAKLNNGMYVVGIGKHTIRRL